MTPTALSELDRMLAEKVQGWHLFTHPALAEGHWCKCADGLHNLDHQIGTESDWCPTRSNEQAMMIAEDIQAQFSLDRFLDLGSKRCWRAMFGHSMKRIKVEEYAGSAAMAICLAAQSWLAAQPK